MLFISTFVHSYLRSAQANVGVIGTGWQFNISLVDVTSKHPFHCKVTQNDIQGKGMFDPSIIKTNMHMGCTSILQHPELL